MAKINLNFKVDIRFRRLLLEAFQKSTFKTLTELIENAVIFYAKEKLNVKQKDYCKHMSRFQGNQVFCSRKGNWVDMIICVRCSEWSD